MSLIFRTLSYLHLKSLHEPSNSSSTTVTPESSTNASAPVRTNPDSTATDITPKEKVYPKRNRAPAVRFEPTWT